MIATFEADYAATVDIILSIGEEREGRNGVTKSSFGRSLYVNNVADNFPLLLGRKMFYKGVLGELAAFFRGPSNVADFEEFGCNYWKTWAKPDGSINVDYGNAWRDFDGIDQLLELRETLLTNPTDRRMIVSGWRPNKLKELDLPCCHYNYQFYVRQGKYLDMIWTQRSVDMMIGLPSDIILAAAWLIALAHDVGLIPGDIKMDLGDCHIYEEHFDQAKVYLNRVDELRRQVTALPTYSYKNDGVFTEFTPEMLSIHGYEPQPAIRFELKE